METTHIKGVIEEFLEKLGVTTERVEIVEDVIHKTPQFQIVTKDSRLLIGSHGAGLHALNHILRQIVRKQTEDDSSPSPFFVDVNNYHTKRVEEVIYKADLIAERAQLFQREVEMPPMSSYERMIVHAHFAEHPRVSTQSQGEGKFRRVVISYGATPTKSEEGSLSAEETELFR